LLHLACALATSGCLTKELDGTWRHPAGDPVRPQTYELALGQYGPEVAGLLRFYQGLGGGEASDPYMAEVHCTIIDNGEVSGERLRFRFWDATGASFFASLALREDRDLLGGQIVAEDDTLNLVRFERVSDEVDRGCGLRAEPIVIHGVLATGGRPPGDQVKVMLAFSGDGEAGRFLNPWKAAVPEQTDGGTATFSFRIATVPAEGYFDVTPTDGSVRFAYAVFLAFEDLDGNGRWDQGYVGDAEPVVGVAPDHALAYLEGRGAAAFPDRPDLAGALDQGYSLVSAVREGGDGPVERLDPGTLDDIVQVIVPAAAADMPDAPLLEAE